MRHVFVGLLILAAVVLAIGGDKPAVNSYVDFGVKLEKTSLRRDSTGTLLLTLKPHKGIHVNTQPGPSFVFDTANGVHASGSLGLSMLEKSTFLDPQKPVRQRFSLAPGVQPGELTIKGTFIYYYCSDAEGWCSRFKQPVEVHLRVTP